MVPSFIIYNVASNLVLDRSSSQGGHRAGNVRVADFDLSYHDRDVYYILGVF